MFFSLIRANDSEATVGRFPEPFRKDVSLEPHLFSLVFLILVASMHGEGDQECPVPEGHSV